MRNLTDEAVFDSIAGAGASMWDWYERFNIDWDGQRLEVVLDNGEGGRESATLTPGSMRRAFLALHASGHPGVAWLDADDDEVDSDIDADIADQVIQYAVLGDVIFG